MVLAPLVGVVLAVAGAIPLLLIESSPLVAAVLAIGLLALLTRGIHLDGLADTADGLGSGRPALGALEVMRKGDVGPFGVVTLVLVLLAQVAALAVLVAEGHGPPALAAALVVSRLALPLACARGVPAARADGLGASVAGSVSRPMALAAVLLGLVLVVVAVVLGGARESLPALLVAASAGLAAGLAVGWHAVRRFGGVTGDVLGAVVEATFTASLVLLSLV
jgi:adenosylcobinamide-GDP ribazoletransferase